MYPARSALPPYCTFLQARFQMVRDDWAQKTSPGSPFLSSLNVLSNALRCTSLMLALSLLSHLLPAASGTLPLLRALSTLQLLAAFSHAVLSRWVHHKTRERTFLSLSVLLAYGVIAFLVQRAVTLALPEDAPTAGQVALMLEVARSQGWHLMFDVADVAAPKEHCTPRPSLLVSF